MRSPNEAESSRISSRRLCFHSSLSVHRRVSAPLHAGIHPPGQTASGQTASGQTPPRQTPPWTDTPQADTTLSRHPPRQTPPGRPPSLCSACWDTVNKRAIRIPLEGILLVDVFHALLMLILITGLILRHFMFLLSNVVIVFISKFVALLK